MLDKWFPPECQILAVPSWDDVTTYYDDDDDDYYYYCYYYYYYYYYDYYYNNNNNDSNNNNNNNDNTTRSPSGAKRAPDTRSAWPSRLSRQAPDAQSQILHMGIRLQFHQL